MRDTQEDASISGAPVKVYSESLSGSGIRYPSLSVQVRIVERRPVYGSGECAT
jgi:hypothetical protein